MPSQIIKNENFIRKSAGFRPVSPISNPPQNSFVPLAAQAALERFALQECGLEPPAKKMN